MWAIYLLGLAILEGLPILIHPSDLRTTKFYLLAGEICRGR